MAEPASRPMFSVVTPVYDPPVAVLQKMIESVVAQDHQSWELVLVDDASPDDGVRTVLRAAAAADPRIVVIERPVNGHIVAASNDGVAAARGTFLALLDHDDLLTPHALSSMAAAIQAEPEADYLYSDEDKVDNDGELYGAFHKPDWSPERLRGQMYTGHLSVLRTDLVREVGGFHLGFEGSQDHDLVLRVTERARKVVHVPEVLYHWRSLAGSTAQSGEAKPYAWTAGARAVQAHLDRLGIDATAETGDWPNCYRVRRRLPAGTRVSVIVPTRGSEAMVWGERRTMVVDAVASLLEHAGHDDVEVVVVHDLETPPSVLERLAQVAGSALRLVPYAKAFNFSEKCNVGALNATGGILLFLNDDIEVTSADFVPTLCAPLRESGVVMTGAKLLFADTTVQHAGLTLHEGHYRQALQGLPGDAPGPFASLKINRECAGLTAACVAITRRVFEDVGGFSEQLPVNFNDVDLSLKLRVQGGRLVWMSDAVAYHFESKTRVAQVATWESDLMVRRWGSLPDDPYLKSGHREALPRHRGHRSRRPDRSRAAAGGTPKNEADDLG